MRTKTQEVLVWFIIDEDILRLFCIKKLFLIAAYLFLYGICCAMAAYKPVELEDRVQFPAYALKVWRDKNGRK